MGVESQAPASIVSHDNYSSAAASEMARETIDLMAVEGAKMLEDEIARQQEIIRKRVEQETKDMEESERLRALAEVERLREIAEQDALRAIADRKRQLEEEEAARQRQLEEEAQRK